MLMVKSEQLVGLRTPAKKTFELGEVSQWGNENYVGKTVPAAVLCGGYAIEESHSEKERKKSIRNR